MDKKEFEQQLAVSEREFYIQRRRAILKAMRKIKKSSDRKTYLHLRALLREVDDKLERIYNIYPYQE